MEKIYLQMYSFGEGEPEKTKSHIEAAAQMGYAGVELFGPDFETDAAALKACLEENHLEAVSLHAPAEKIESLIPYAKTLGLSFIGIGMHYLPDMAAVDAFCARLNELGAVCRENGMMLTYHNHTQEFAVLGDKTIIEHILDKTNPDDVNLELDAGWCAAAGYDPVEFVRAHPGRVRLIHIKESKEPIGVQKPVNPDDIRRDEHGEPIISDEDKAIEERNKKINCPAGQGLVDWRALMDAATPLGCAAYIVEREYTYAGTRLDCLKADIEYYKTL